MLEYSLVVFVPTSDAEALKSALFKAGAGKIGQYEHCCFQLSGQGQFKPLSLSTPTVGEKHTDNFVEEQRLEILCSASCIQKAIVALKKAHPYETPVYYVTKLATIL